MLYEYNKALGVGSRSTIHSASPRAVWASWPHPLCFITHTTGITLFSYINIKIDYFVRGFGGLLPTHQEHDNKNFKQTIELHMRGLSQWPCVIVGIR